MLLGSKKRLLSSLCALLVAVGVAHADLAHDLAGLISRGRFDEVIAQTDKVLAEPGSPDQRVAYLRARAELGLARLDVAARDAAPLGDFRPWPGWEAASALARHVGELQRLAPPGLTEVKSGDAILFRVHHDPASEWARDVIALLPEASRKVSELYGLTPAETEVYIFDDSKQHDAFFKAMSGRDPKSWQWAGAACGVLLFCKERHTGEPAAAPGKDYFRSVVAHELGHCAVWRLGCRALPPWLSEGLAMVCGALMAPDDQRTNDRVMASLIRNRRVVPLAALMDRERFYALDTYYAAYAEGFSMSRFLYARVGRNGILELLRLQSTGMKMDDALQSVWHTDQRGLHAAWIQASAELAALPRPSN